MFQCFTSNTHASTSSTHVRTSSSSMSCMESRTRIPTFHREEASQLRFVRGPTIPATEYTPSGIFAASYIHHDISHRIPSSTHVGRQRPLLHLWRKAFCEMMLGGYLRHSKVAGGTDLKFFRKYLLRFTFPTALRWRCNSALKCRAGKIARRRVTK